MHANVKYELLQLERLLSGGRPLLKESHSESAFRQKIKTEVERIKQRLIYEIFNFEDERHLERYIQYHQQALIRLIDKCVLVTDGTAPIKQQNYLKILYAGFDELLSFIERHFTKYFDQDSKAPESYIELARKDAQLNIQKINNGFETRSADKRLVDLLTRVPKKIINSSTGIGITYRYVLYAKEIQKELLRLLDKTPSAEEINEEIRQIIYYLNYNSTQVLTYHAHFISALLDAVETRAEKIEKLSFTLKKINQAQVKPGTAYNQNSASLKSQLSSYISEELDYHERLQQLANRPPGSSNDSFMDGFRLKFEASVSQLAYLIKVLIGTKLILNNNVTQVFHFLVRFAITKRSEAISFASFRAKFYNVEVGTKQSVRSMLLSMIHYIDHD